MAITIYARIASILIRSAQQVALKVGHIAVLQYCRAAIYKVEFEFFLARILMSLPVKIPHNCL
jgi:hypothetical protein